MWMKGSAEVPWQYVRATMCERFGWTLDYWDSLDVEEVNEILAVWAGAEKAQPKAGKHG